MVSACVQKAGGEFAEVDADVVGKIAEFGDGQPDEVHDEVPAVVEAAEMIWPAAEQRGEEPW